MKEQTGRERIRVLIVDDHAVVRQGLRSLLADDPDFDLVGEAGSGEEALRQVQMLQPDVVLLDIRMPGMDGLEVTRRLRTSHPQVRIIILTTYAEDEYLVEALRAGARGYLLKSILYEDLARSIKDVYRGSRLLAPDLVGRVMELAGSLARGEPAGAPAAAAAPPSARGAEVPVRFDLRFGPGSWERLVAGYGRGQSATELAAQLGTTAQTVRNWLVKGGVVQRLPGRGRPPKQGQTPTLSEREREILRIIASGASNKEAAARLGISVNTVRVHVHDIFRKLGIKSRTQAALYVLRTERQT